MSQPAEPRPPGRTRGEATQRRLVLQIARRLSATLGEDFFQSLVRNLAEALAIECVFLGELCGKAQDRLRSLAVVHNHDRAQGFEQRLSGTAVGQVLADGAFACSKDAARIFPDDPLLNEIPAEGFAGIRLSDSAGQPLGAIVIAGKRPLSDVQLAKAVLGAFAPRVAAELERKRNDDMHRESEERYHAFIASNPDAMWRLEFDQPVSLDQTEEDVLDQLYRHGYLAEANDALARLFGRDRADQMLGMTLEDFAPRADFELQAELLTAIRNRFQSTLVERVLTSAEGGHTYRLRSQFGIVENGELRRIWGSTRDITSLRHAELAASVLERRFREMLEGIQLPALMLDPQGRIAFCNDTFVRLTARSRPELTALTWMEGIVPAADGEAWKTAISRTPSQEAPTYHFEGEILAADGSTRLVQWDTICLRGADNQVAALAAVGRDLTYERALEAEIRRAQKLDGLGRLAAGIAHDFNNLLMIVMGQADQLLDHVSEADRAYGPLLEIIHAATHCSRLSERLLALGRKQLIKPQLVDINQLVDEIEALLRSMAGAGVAFKVERAPELPLVLADPTQMHEVLANLVTNARDAMPVGGRLTVSTDIVTVADQDPGYPGIKPGPYIKLSVSDTGFGLTEEVKAHIFEPFFTTKEPGKGTGLGLSTVYAIVKQSGGHITVRSVRGRGTTFEILLPAPPPVIH